jgi:hypothetical protein
VLLAQVLLGFAIRFEQHSRPSLALCANVLRILDPAGVRVRDLPVLGGVSKESVSMAMGILEKADLVTVGREPDGGRWKVARLTAAGQVANGSTRTRSPPWGSDPRSDSGRVPSRGCGPTWSDWRRRR